MKFQTSYYYSNYHFLKSPLTRLKIHFFSNLNDFHLFSKNHSFISYFLAAFIRTFPFDCYDLKIYLLILIYLMITKQSSISIIFCLFCCQLIIYISNWISLLFSLMISFYLNWLIWKSYSLHPCLKEIILYDQNLISVHFLQFFYQQRQNTPLKKGNFDFSFHSKHLKNSFDCWNKVLFLLRINTHPLRAYSNHK